MEKISFFSYKGGSGRSSIAYNVIPFLAESLGATSENPIIVVDMDVDSAGMTYLLQAESDEPTRKGKYYTTQEFLEGDIPGSVNTPNDCPINNHPFFSRLNPVGTEFGLGCGEQNDRKILLIEAEPGYNFDSYNGGGRATNPILKLARLCNNYGCKALIFDTPSGDQQTAKWSIAASNIVVCCMRVTVQFRYGTINYLKRKDLEHADKRFIVVPNAVPQDPVMIRGVKYDFDFMHKDMFEDFEKIKLKNNKLDMGMFEDGYLGIPEVKRFKFREGILFKEKNRQNDEELAIKSYEKLSSLILRSSHGS